MRAAFVHSFDYDEHIDLLALVPLINQSPQSSLSIIFTLFSQFIIFPNARRCFEDTPTSSLIRHRILSMTTPVYNDITSPFNKPWDLSQKADQERWLIASQSASDQVYFDISVATAETFLELLKDKSDYYRWGPLMTVPISGDGAFGGTTAKLANGKEVMKINFGDKHHLLTQWTKVHTAKCKQFAQWYNGDDSIRLDSPFEADPMKRKVVALNCNDKNNKGLVCHYKFQLCIINQLILHVLKNHLTTSTFKSFLAHKNEFSFLDEKTGNKFHSGLVLMRKMLDICKPEMFVEVQHLEKELDTILLWPTHENNVCLLTTCMMTLLQEIHAKTGKASYTDQRFITNLI
jgi:hypothetical protein